MYKTLNMKLKIIILISLFLYGTNIVTAQRKNRKNNDQITIKQDTIKSTPVNLTTEEFKKLHLPALETLFETAKNNPRLKAVEMAMEEARCDLKKSRRDWLQFFSVHAGYNYGILGTYVDTETQYNPLTTVYSGTSQSSWSVGANVNIPLNLLLNQRQTIKKQQQTYMQSQYEKEITFNEIKNEIIEIYCNIQYQLKLLKIATESLTLYDSEYFISEADFVNNHNSKNEALSDLKHKYQVALTEYETIINTLNILILKLEIISNTKILNK